MATKLPAPGAADVLYIVDISGYVFRAYHAIAPLSSPSGEPTHAVYGTVNLLSSLIRQRRPHLLAVAMDSKGPTFRKELFDGYKANRPPPPPDLSQQMERVRQIVDAFEIPVFQKDGIEADDFIGTLVQHAKQQGLRTVIVSADKDLTQLVDEEVMMWDSMRNRVFGIPEVEEKFSVKPSQIRDLLALMGDASDNIPGVPSVGPKTASTLLNEYNDIDGIYANLDKISRKKLRETLEQNADNAKLSRELVGLKLDCELSFEPSELLYSGPHFENLAKLYEELGFSRLLDELKESAEAAGVACAPHSPQKSVKLEWSSNELQKIHTILQQAKSEGQLYIEALSENSDPMRGELSLIAISTSTEMAHLRPSDGAAFDALIDFIRGAKLQLISHDFKHTAIALLGFGVEALEPLLDIKLAAFLLDHSAKLELQDLIGNEFSFAIPAIADIYAGSKKSETLVLSAVTPELILDCLAKRLVAMRELSPRIMRELETANLIEIHERIERPLIPLLTVLQSQGIEIDSSRLAELSIQCSEQIEALTSKAYELAGHEFNINSPRQLETILFDELGLKPLKKTKTSRSTDALTLQSLAEEHPLPECILENRQLTKLKGTYIDSLPLLVNKRTGRLHSHWEQTIAATGRLSSSDPNLQNIPIRTGLGREISACFKAAKGKLLVAADYSQIELRVLAHLSQDPVLIEAFRTGEDIHNRTAMEIFDLDADEIDAEHRRRAKAINFGVIYGQGDSALAKSLGISRSEAGMFIAAYFRRYAKVSEYMNQILEGARSGGNVRTLLGRRRAINDIQSGNRALRLAAERIAMNTPIQGTAADILKLAMLRFQEEIVPGAKMLLSVHDELIFEVPEDAAELAAKKIRTEMENAYPLDVPLLVEVGIAANWANAK